MPAHTLEVLSVLAVLIGKFARIHCHGDSESRKIKAAGIDVGMVILDWGPAGEHHAQIIPFPACTEIYVFQGFIIIEKRKTGK